MTAGRGGWVIDHLFAWCRRGAPEAERLEAAGLRVGVRRRHPGQGTANACFCFADSYLELLWIEDDAEAAAAPASPLGLGERARWRERGGSPFGICLRPPGPGAEPPFDGFEYTPEYLPAGMPPIRIARSARADEPLLFALERPYRPPPVAHVLAHRRVACAQLLVPDLPASSPLARLPVPELAVRAGPAHALELEFDGPAAGMAVDLQPDLPLVLRW